MEHRQVGTRTLCHLHAIIMWPKIRHKTLSFPFCPLTPSLSVNFSGALVGSNSQETEVTRAAAKPPVWGPAAGPPPLTYLRVAPGTAPGLHQEALRASPSLFLQAAKTFPSFRSSLKQWVLFHLVRFVQFHM